MSEAIIRIHDVEKIYSMGDIQVAALAGVSLEIEQGEFTAIMGPSGSGKSTLMNILGCLDQPTSGSYLLDGIETSELSDEQLAWVRSRKIGFVFQGFNLLARTSALEQVELPLLYSRTPNRRERALEALESVGLADRIHHGPTELSGGQQQRVAIARALVNDPVLILADEPTGALDSRTTEEIIELFKRLNQERGITVLIVTHEPEVAAHTRRVIYLRDGIVSRDERRVGRDREAGGQAEGDARARGDVEIGRQGDTKNGGQGCPRGLLCPYLNPLAAEPNGEGVPVVRVSDQGGER